MMLPRTLCATMMALAISLQPGLAQTDMTTSIDHENATHASAQCLAANDARDWEMQAIYCMQAAEYWGTLANNDALSTRARRYSLAEKGEALVRAAQANYGLGRRENGAALLKSAIAAYNEEAAISSGADKSNDLALRDKLKQLLKTMPSQ